MKGRLLTAACAALLVFGVANQSAARASVPPAPANDTPAAAKPVDLAWDAIGRQDYDAAEHLLKPLVDAGDPDAKYAMGAVYMGRGVSAAQQKDYAEALRLLKLGADAGVPEATYNLGTLYEFGWGVPRDHAEAMRQWSQTAVLLAPGIRNGDAQAQYLLGLLYENGKGVERNSVEAARSYKLAADQGHADAEVNLGLLTEFGWGVAPDVAEARRLYTLAADQGNVGAHWRLGLIDEGGSGGPPDFAAAAENLEFAAYKGNAEAQYALAMLYAAGRGVPRDAVMARTLMTAAAGKVDLARDWLASHADASAKLFAPTVVQLRTAGALVKPYVGSLPPSSAPPVVRPFLGSSASPPMVTPYVGSLPPDVPPPVVRPNIGSPPPGTVRAPSVITNPDWVRMPNGEDLADLYPAAAKARMVRGRSSMECEVTAAGDVSNCRIIDEAPLGYGFGAATMRMSAHFKMRPQTVDGQPVGGAKVVIPIAWTMADTGPEPVPANGSPPPPAEK